MSLLEDALKYRSENVSVIPVGRDKIPLTPWQEYQTRLATVEEIQNWWRAYPDANVGIVTGRLSNLVVVDVEKGGSTDGFPVTAIAKTGGGGWHYYYRYCEGVTNKARILPLTDIRGEGGYVVSPNSLHASGNRYEWILKIPPEPFPAEYFQGVVEKKQTAWKEVVSGVPQGSRNDTAAKMFGKLMNTFPPSDWETIVWPMGIQWNKNNNPPLPERELRTIFRSIGRRAVNDVRYDDTGKKVEDTKDVSFLTFTEVLEKGHEELLNTKKEDVISFGYDWLDFQLTGLFPGELVVVGSESGCGKTTFATNIIYKASQKHLCTVFALEDRLEDYAIKALYFKIGQLRKQMNDKSFNYPWNDFRKNDIQDPNFQTYLRQAKEELKNDNIYFAKVDGMMNINILEKLIENQVARGVQLFLIDHLHYFDLYKSDMTKADYIETVMVRIKTLQRKTGARIILIVHYKKLDGKKPTLDSFKDSISIIQNANYVINIWRDRSEGNREKQYKTTFYIPKSRNPNGEGKREVEFDPTTGDYKPITDWQFGTAQETNGNNNPGISENNLNQLKF